MLSDETITLDELARRAHVSPRAIRYYLTTGLLERPPKHGRELRFDRDQVTRLQAIRELQRKGLSLDAIARQLDRMPPREWQAFTRPGHAPSFERLLMAAEPTEDYGVPSPDVTLVRQARLQLSRVGDKEVWVRVRVTPEVEMQYRAEGGARIQEAVREIAEFARRRLSAVPPEEPRATP